MGLASRAAWRLVFSPVVFSILSGSAHLGASIDRPSPLGFGIVREGKGDDALHAARPPPPSPDVDPTLVVRPYCPLRRRSPSFESQHRRSRLTLLSDPY